jgi:tripartite-type tricarboxylate transporter receptor subunit TctC
MRPAAPNDIIARILAQKLAEELGGNFFVENTAGAGGTIATGQAANAAADGTTILIANQDLIVQPIIRTKVPYDPFKSFTPVSLVVSAPEMIVVHLSLPGSCRLRWRQQSGPAMSRNPIAWSGASNGPVSYPFSLHVP